MLLKSIKIARQIKKAEKVYYSDKYYKDINEIPLYNYWKCMYGDYTYLWKKRKLDVPFFFERIFNDMTFQMDHIDLTAFRKKVDSKYFRNKYLTTGNIKYKRKAAEKQKQSEDIEKRNDKEQKLNDVIKVVQIALKLSFQIDPHKITAGYFLSLYAEVEKMANKSSYVYN